MALQNISNRKIRRLPPDMQRFFIQESQRELLRQAKADAAKKKAEAEAKKAAAAKQEKAVAEVKKWRDSILNDKNYLTLKQILEAQGFGDRIKGSVAQNELGENIVQESPELVKLAGMLRGINDLSPENLNSNIARIALQNMPDAYGKERWGREITPFVANRVKLDKDGKPVYYEDGKEVLEPANPEADDILARFQQSPELQVRYLVNKGRGMTHEDAFRDLRLNKPDGEITLGARRIKTPSAPPMDPVLARMVERRKKYIFPTKEDIRWQKETEELYNPRILKLVSEHRKKHPEMWRGGLTPAQESPYVFRADAFEKYLASPEMDRLIRKRMEKDRRVREFKAYMANPANFKKIADQTKASRAERFMNALDDYIYQNYFVPKMWKGRKLPKYSFDDHLIAMMNKGQSIPIKSGRFVMTPSAAKMSKDGYMWGNDYFYDSPEFKKYSWSPEGKGDAAFVARRDRLYPQIEAYLKAQDDFRAGKYSGKTPPQIEEFIDLNTTAREFADKWKKKYGINLVQEKEFPSLSTLNRDPANPQIPMSPQIPVPGTPPDTSVLPANPVLPSSDPSNLSNPSDLLFPSLKKWLKLDNNIT